MIELAIVFLAIFGCGFVTGYSVRSYLSHRRREKSRRQAPAHQS